MLSQNGSRPAWTLVGPEGPSQRPGQRRIKIGEKKIAGKKRFGRGKKFRRKNNRGLWYKACGSCHLALSFVWGPTAQNETSTQSMHILTAR